MCMSFIASKSWQRRIHGADVAPFGATSERRIACADVALNGSHLRICEISPRIAASLLPLRNLANPAIRYGQCYLTTVLT